MKKLIGLMVLLMTIVTLSASAQCPTVYQMPGIYGDLTPCKNEKNVIYSLGNSTVGLPIKWTWCYAIPGKRDTVGFVPSEFRWSVDPNSGVSITDGVNVSGRTTGTLTTTQTSVALSFKSKGTALTASFKDSCGNWIGIQTLLIYTTCQPGNGTFPVPAPAAIDTGKTILNATCTHGNVQMSFTFDSIAGLKKPYSNINMFVKIPTISCADNFAIFFSDGGYQQTRQTSSLTLPFYVAYGYSYYYANASSGPRTFRLNGVDGDGKAFRTLPFTIPTNVPSINTFPVLPAP